MSFPRTSTILSIAVTPANLSCKSLLLTKAKHLAWISEYSLLKPSALSDRELASM